MIHCDESLVYLFLLQPVLIESPRVQVVVSLSLLKLTLVLPNHFGDMSVDHFLLLDVVHCP